jgi:CheY-like chemotaxis protein
MSLSKASLTILHVEDDPMLVKLVQTAFEGFGFRGRMISAGGVNEALDLLDRCARNNEPVNLILVDMRLPDGTGLDVIRELKSDPLWQRTPVIVLSSETASGMVNGAYALGANCYVPKIPRSKSPLDLLRSLYEYWLKDTLLPRAHSRDRLQIALARAIRLRARTSDFFLGLARAYDGEPEEMGFWLDRSLNAGNLSNLLAFFRNLLSEKDVPADMIGRIGDMQFRVRKALTAAEGHLRGKPAPSPEEACRWVLDLMGALDEELTAEFIGRLFPKGPAATTALKACAASQVKDLATHILEKTDEAELRQRARSLLTWAERLAAETEDANTSSAEPADTARQT